MKSCELLDGVVAISCYDTMDQPGSIFFSGRREFIEINLSKVAATPR
jgi:hypothetical protein